MESTLYMQIAEDGLAMPLATNMVLHEEASEADIERALSNGEELGRCPCASRPPLWSTSRHSSYGPQARKRTAFAGPWPRTGPAPGFHFKQAPTATEVQAMITALAAPLPPALKAQVDAVRFVVRSAPDLVPCAMTIGPFSLMTTLLEDPISAVYLASTGATANDEPAVALLDVALELSMRAVERSLRAQLDGGGEAGRAVRTGGQ